MGLGDPFEISRPPNFGSRPLLWETLLLVKFPPSPYFWIAFYSSLPWDVFFEVFCYIWSSFWGHFFCLVTFTVISLSLLSLLFRSRSFRSFFGRHFFSILIFSVISLWLLSLLFRSRSFRSYFGDIFSGDIYSLFSVSLLFRSRSFLSFFGGLFFWGRLFSSLLFPTMFLPLSHITGSFFLSLFILSLFLLRTGTTNITWWALLCLFLDRFGSYFQGVNGNKMYCYDWIRSQFRQSYDMKNVCVIRSRVCQDPFIGR